MFVFAILKNNIFCEMCWKQTNKNWFQKIIINSLFNLWYSNKYVAIIIVLCLCDFPTFHLIWLKTKRDVLSKCMLLVFTILFNNICSYFNIQWVLVCLVLWGGFELVCINIIVGFDFGCSCLVSIITILIFVYSPVHIRQLYKHPKAFYIIFRHISYFHIHIYCVIFTVIYWLNHTYNSLSTQFTDIYSSIY